ncbi:MAG: hypothetical protein CMP37_03745 [Rickettsiales bacterium]|nr:hypothetical protein [Rickettsiales bacterium]|tara:strand:- start:12501 stop:13028 length:528 start_codon:yes stop_codon:yes gene_type:complete
MTTAEKLSNIQVEFKAKKSRFNSFGKYNFRSAEDILEALKPINKKYRVYFTVNETFIQAELPVIETTATMFDIDDNSKIAAKAIVAVDLNQKGMATPQQFGSASSYAKKYALGNLLLIDDTADADATNDHGKLKPKISSNNIDKAKKFLDNGGLLKTLQDKYDIEPTALKQLQNG